MKRFISFKSLLSYRVDDISFNSSPSDTFDQKGVAVTYYEYYERKYNIKIRDRKQPMLISNPKARDVRAGRDQLLFLVPELCNATGLTDKMRNNFQMMRAMADHTQMDPERRKNRLLELAKRLHTTEASKKVLADFNTDISKELVSFTGRALPQETMLFGNGAK